MRGTERIRKTKKTSETESCPGGQKEIPMGVTKKFAGFVVETSFGSFPREAIAKTKEATLDCMGVILSAVNEPIGEISIKYVREKGGVPEAGVVERYHATSENFFIDLTDGPRIRVERDAAGAVVALQVLGGPRALRIGG